MSIRTPDQRVRVFVSSTLQELTEERRAAHEAIETLRLTPVMFEHGARPHPPRALYRAYVEQSDVFIGLYWERYGWIAPDEAVSGLEDEYSLAGDRPKLIYVKTPAPNREPRLTELIARIERDDRASYRPFGDAQELKSLVADDLAVLLTERFAAAAPGAEPSRPQRLPPLPRPPTRLIGRDGDISGVVDSLADPGTRMITIVGPGGIGKSRLALAVAVRAADRYADGVAYIELAPVSAPQLLLSAIANALGVQERAGSSIGAQLRERLATAQMLIVLDNMEQLTAAANDMADLLAGTESLQLLVTSRRILNIRGERVFTIQPLAVSDGGATIAPAVELFVDRARAVRPGYRPSDEDMAAIAELTRRLDGLPLAIELASARLRTLSPGGVLERMGHQRLEFLRTGARDLPPRQRTLRDTIAWSHSLLPPDSQLLFARLAVFVGSADLVAIEQVANPEGRLDALEVLADLVDESLARVTGEAAEPRFGMLETIREFAVERLESGGEAADCRARHQAYYLELAERGKAALGTAEQIEWLNRLDRENDNLRAVLRRALRRDDSATALRMGRALTSYWYMRSHHSEGREWMEQIAALPSAGPHERAIARTIGAIQAFLQGNFEPLEVGLDDVLRAAADDEDRRLVAFAQLLRAIARGTASDDERWQEGLTEASRRLEEAGEPLAVGFGLVAGALVARLHGRTDDARRLAQAAHDLSTRIGESYVRMAASTQLAGTALELGDMSSAQRHARDGLRAAQRLRNMSVGGYLLELWAAAELGDERIESAAELFALAERGYREASTNPWPMDARRHDQLGAELHAALGDRYDQMLASAWAIDYDQTIAELTRS